ncbi:MAG: class I tRNA ligase family protein, partial [Parachlamydia sp.]|nr:class I tRNA ligase family protein [Parachlamydia sp.]
LPFPETFLHGLIYGKSYWRDNPGGGITYVTEKERHDYEMGKPVPKGVHFKWEKMSKSKGNIIDPLEIIEQYGTDAMRMALCSSSPQSREIDLDLRRFEEFKNFANKVWNGARFVFMNLEGLTSEEFSSGISEEQLELEDRWILSVLNRTVRDVNAKLATYFFDQAALEAYDFFWKEFCSYYVEISKPILTGKVGSEAKRKNKQKLLAIVLCQVLRLIHPMAPFITEELFQLLKARLADLTTLKTADPYTLEAIQALQSPACIVAPYPKVIRESDLNPAIDRDFQLVEQVVYTIRNIRGEMKLPPSASIAIHIVGEQNDPNFLSLKERSNIITALIRTEKIVLHTEAPQLPFASTGVVESLKIMIPVPIDMLHQEKGRLEKERERLESMLNRLRGQLENQEFVANAPAQLVDKQKKTLQQTETELSEVAKKLEALR